METVFLGMFVVGLAVVVLSFVLGLAHADLPFAPDIFADHHLHADASDAGATPFNLGTVSAFLTWFGGVGYILLAQDRFGLVPVLLLSTAGGLFGAAIVFLLLVKVLLPGQTAYLRESDYEVEGALARVSVPLAPGRTGEIIFQSGGAVRSEGARSADGSPIPRGTEVVVMRYEKGIAYVEPLDKLLAERQSTTLSAGEPRDEGAAR